MPNNEMIDRELEALAAPLTRPYSTTKSNLGISTKLFAEQFICDRKGLAVLHGDIMEKLASLRPENIEFQYLIRLNDKTHREHNDLEQLAYLLENSSKSTEKVLMKWVVSHVLDGQANELSVTIRISRPTNPLIVFQAALSKNIDDIDNVEFEGPVAVSINGAGQILVEELFAVAGRWIDSRPRPVQGIDFPKFADKNNVVIEFAHVWVLPSLFALSILLLLRDETDLETMMLIMFAGIIGHEQLCRIGYHVNRRLEKWVRTASKFSMFELTNGDSNRQTKYAAKAKACTIKLV